MEHTSHGITTSRLLERAVLNMGYPSAITCAVTYQEELRRMGRPVWVRLDLTGAGKELAFMCKTYEEVDHQQLNGIRNGELKWTDKAKISIFSPCSTGTVILHASRVHTACSAHVYLSFH